MATLHFCSFCSVTSPAYPISYIGRRSFYRINGAVTSGCRLQCSWVGKHHDRCRQLRATTSEDANNVRPLPDPGRPPLPRDTRGVVQYRSWDESSGCSDRSGSAGSVRFVDRLRTHLLRASERDSFTDRVRHQASTSRTWNADETQNGAVISSDKVNMSVAILPMAQQFGWSASVAGLVQSAFFWGYLLSQVPAGYLANRLGGRAVLPAGVALWSGFTAMVPLLAGTIPSLCLSRAAVGFGEGVAPSAITDIVVKCVPARERARAISTIFGGLHIGSIFGLLAAPPLITHFGWAAVFYAFGAVGIVWVVLFDRILRSNGGDMPAVREQLRPLESVAGSVTALRGVPYRAFLRNGPVRALMFTHFCNNWFHYTMLAWLPTYFTRTLSLGLTQASMVTLLPSIAGLIVSGLSGQLADRLIEGGMAVRDVRNLAQSTAFLLPAVFLCAASMCQGTSLAIFFIAAALGLNSFASSGLYCTHQDMSTEYAGPLLGLTNTSGAVPGIIGVAFVGYLMDATGSWLLALFAPICILFVLGTACYVIGASSEPQEFSDNSPFAFEVQLRRWWGETPSRKV